MAEQNRFIILESEGGWSGGAFNKINDLLDAFSCYSAFDIDIYFFQTFHSDKEVLFLLLKRYMVVLFYFIYLGKEKKFIKLYIYFQN